MRLNKIKLAGFKSFVDPTSVQLPGNLTGVVGPNGCGKSNIIDAVRWVMGELSARHLRGDSMADVIFNGSSARKPVGAASVELMFDNGDGKIGGAYASYNEISLKRTVERDGTSAYFINGGRCRRKDITQLFLGTGLGSRSYAIIEQGMISRVIEARTEDMRAFIEEAAGISLYKERRRETESRIADTRENLARRQDLRDEVDKQIRHLQRQANVARRYQELKTQERTADRGAAGAAAAGARQWRAAAGQRGAKLRARHAAGAGGPARERGGHREAARVLRRAQRGALARAGPLLRARRGGHAHRGEHSLRARAARAGAHGSRASVSTQLAAIAEQIVRDEEQLAACATEMRRARAAGRGAHAQRGAAPAPRLPRRRAAGRLAAALGGLQSRARRRRAERRGRGRAHRAAGEPEPAAARAGRPAGARARSVSAAQADAPLETFSDAGSAGARGAPTHSTASSAGAGAAAAAALGAAAGRRPPRAAAAASATRFARELLSLEALQKAALRREASRGSGLAGGSAWSGRAPRLAEMLEVGAGWERAVETVLGDYLEAVRVDSLEPLEARSERWRSAA